MAATDDLSRQMPFNALKPSEFDGDAIQYLLAVYPESLFEAEQQGLFYRPPPGDSFQTTFTGAFRLAWQELWPTSALRRRRRDREAAALLQELSR